MRDHPKNCYPKLFQDDNSSFEKPWGDNFSGGLKVFWRHDSGQLNLTYLKVRLGKMLD